MFEKCASEGAVRGAWEGAAHANFALAGILFYLSLLHSFSIQKTIIYATLVAETAPGRDLLVFVFRKSSETRKVRFDCTSAYGLHASPRRGAPKAAQNYVNKTYRFHDFFRDKFENQQTMTANKYLNG